ncbi:dTMP kinase [Promicromonospora thailandica]|uniref:Thymidylate kinase n=1 Tax=Promicromonospora thailandica TaxID=765201 RepID=A0A9X2JTK7_9MICO|nr:dTMP kinase [Promicromonospora thailandica]MCP2263535.1 dTMP kinase [Promicromonospora thailandica]BFF19282.1 dTMP kinase [Promicromonospora thailandica]
MNAPGYFISFEGGEGVGKSTQARLLGDWLAGLTGREVVLTREPGGTALGEELRAAVMHGQDMGPRAEALIYAADRAHHVETVVRPTLERGGIVVTDRYLDSSVAYQSGGRDLPAHEVEHISLWAARGLRPDVTVLLDLEPGYAVQRRAAAEGKGGLDRLERAGLDFHTRVRNTFLERAAADPDRWVVIDAAASIEDIQAQVRVDVAVRLGLTPVVVEATGIEGPGSDPEEDAS